MTNKSFTISHDFSSCFLSKNWVGVHSTAFALSAPTSVPFEIAEVISISAEYDGLQYDANSDFFAILLIDYGDNYGYL